MTLKLFSTTGGDVFLPDAQLVLVDRNDGGNLIVCPAKDVWERSALTADELTQWSFLVAATGKAMLDVLPQLQGGCINYWEAGNWALNEAAEPTGPKTAPEHRKVHLHLLGRSPTAKSSSWQWGEAPIFPAFADRYSWASSHERLSADECKRILSQTETVLKSHYRVAAEEIASWVECDGCGYPIAVDGDRKLCVECGKPA